MIKSIFGIDALPTLELLPVHAEARHDPLFKCSNISLRVDSPSKFENTPGANVPGFLSKKS